MCICMYVWILIVYLISVFVKFLSHYTTIPCRAVARPQKWRRRNLLAYPEYPHGHCVFLHSIEFLLSCPFPVPLLRLLCLSLATALPCDTLMVAFS